MQYVAVGAGAVLGANLRFVVANWAAARWGADFPYGTFIINITGCFLIAFFLTLTTERVTVHEGWRYLFPIGFVGAYTTFSTYEFETMQLIQTGAWMRAATYVLFSTVAGLAAVFLAAWVARRF
jgi:fluoride exporter